MVHGKSHPTTCHEGTGGVGGTPQPLQETALAPSVQGTQWALGV